MIDRSIILNGLVDLIVRTALVFSLFLLFAGHNAPGGGFIAGLVAGIAFILQFVAAGRERIREVMWGPPEVLMGVGLALSLVTGTLGWVWGNSFLHSAELELHLPLLGELKAGSALPFDIGVFIVVVGLTSSLLLSLGREDSE